MDRNTPKRKKNITKNKTCGENMNKPKIMDPGIQNTY